MRRALVVTLLASLIVLGRGPGPAAACDCTIPEPGEARARADVVFTGRHLGVEAATGGPVDEQSSEPVRHRFAVDRAYKGDVEAEIEVLSSLHSASCGYVFAPGRYVVFASRGPDGLGTSSCSGTGPLAAAAAPEGLGEGRAVDPPARADPPPGEGDAGSGSPGRPIGGPEGDVEGSTRMADAVRSAAVVAVALAAAVGVGLLVRATVGRRRAPARR